VRRRELCERAPQSMHRRSTVGKACQRPALGPERLMFLGDDYEARRSALWFDPTGRAPRAGPGALQCYGMIGAAGAVGFNGEGRTGGVKRPLFPHEGARRKPADENFSGYDAIGVQDW
jgi:hypothetical protein